MPNAWYPFDGVWLDDGQTKVVTFLATGQIVKRTMVGGCGYYSHAISRGAAAGLSLLVVLVSFLPISLGCLVIGCCGHYKESIIPTQYLSHSLVSALSQPGLSLLSVLFSFIFDFCPHCEGPSRLACMQRQTDTSIWNENVIDVQEAGEV